MNTRIDTSASSQLIELAEFLTEELGPGFFLRRSYPFAVPERDGLREERAEAAVFSSPIPSMQTAKVGFAAVADERSSSAEGLAVYAYLGAPLLVTGSDRAVSLYRFSGSPFAEKLEEIPLSASGSDSWIRERLRTAVESPQLSLGLATSRHLLIQDTQAVLGDRVSALIELARAEAEVSDLDAFRIAVAAVRLMFFGTAEYPSLAPDLYSVASNLADQFSGTLTFANIPPESIAEFYESFAVTPAARRRSGVVYTPAWLARYVVSRISADAFREGRAIDPTCGSGTFLVCFLERLIEEHAMRGGQLDGAVLAGAVAGIDKDPVAIETARLSLDFFCRAIGIDSGDWDLSIADATEVPVQGEWVIGNLPFGYRTHQGRQDISAVILENIERTNRRRQGIAMILPDSLSYIGVAHRARELLRADYQIQEITRLPEEVFTTSSAKTMVVVGRKGVSSREVLVREVTAQNLRSFRSGEYVSRTYISRLPERAQDPWRFSPFNNAFERAERLGVRLGESCSTRMGLQIYGREDTVVTLKSTRSTRPLLTDVNAFSSWTPKSIAVLPGLVGGKEDVRRPGPWGLFNEPKVIVRATTVPGSYDRLAAVADTQGVWFTDKFAGIWPGPSAPSIPAIAAYLQTRFARLWFDTNNPSRKLRISILDSFPIPKLPVEWWDRAARLAKLDTVVRPLVMTEPLEIPFRDPDVEEWNWFNAAVESAFGIDPSTASAMVSWLHEQQRTSR